ncbi:MAG: M23 family metallopeptidase [Clostridiales bacterium]|nr:M23 family metallopeptidase [Clostridiales bacterium]
MKEKINQMLRDKLFLVMLVLGLLTIVAAAGVARMQRRGGSDTNPYVDIRGQEELLAEDPPVPVAGESDAGPAEEKEEKLAGQDNPDTAVREEEMELARKESAALPADHAAGEEAVEAGAGLEAASALALDFSPETRMSWPVRGNVLLDYSMDTTIYFPTLDQYKCNPALVIQGEISDPVCAPANARVLKVASNEEIGNYLTLDLGNGYTAVCGQLKEIAAAEGEYLTQGQLLGYVAEPTKYYTVEGSNVYFALQQDGQTIDPLDVLE